MALMVIAGVVAALVAAPDSASTNYAQVSTPSSGGSGPPSTIADHTPLPLPDLDLPPLEPDPAWWRSSAAPGAIGVVWVSREGSDPSSLFDNEVQRSLYKDLTACFPENATNEQLFKGKSECFDEKVIRAAATTPNPTDVFTAVRAMNTARPDVFTVCHNASHKVGEIALRRVVMEYGMDKEIIAAMLDRGANACMGGLMHGTLDAVGFVAKSVSEFRPAVEACLLANPINLGYCTDAVGHASWDAFFDKTKAAEVCSFFKDEQSRRECGEGILMRIYQRAEVDDLWYEGSITAQEDLDRWNSEVIALCEDWPSKPFAAAPENPKEWCWSGSTYLFIKPVFYALERVSKGDIESAFPEVAARFKKTVESCEKFPAPGDALCLKRLGPSVGHLAAFDKEYAVKLCEMYTNKELMAECSESAVRRIEQAYEE